jgi:hypothetical protein
MAGRIRVLDAANRTMQRLGFLKLLCALVNETETSNLASLGKRLVERVTKRVRLPLPVNEHLRDYVKCRLTDGIYRDLRKAVLEGTNNGAVSLEMQDVYLSDFSLPSRTGKLVESNWRMFPSLGTSLELIRKGTYSALTRSLLLFNVTPKEELAAFAELDLEHNPLIISDSQAMVLLYCFIDNDAEVLFPLFQNLYNRIDNSFDDRSAGEILPNIFRQIVKYHGNRAITFEERERLTLITKTANSIDKWKGRTYTGGGAPQEAVTVRLEPLCDLGFFTKPNRDRYEYQTTKALKILLERWGSLADTDTFLQERFFRTFASCRKMKVYPATDSQAKEALFQAGETLKSTLGYSPITDVSLLAGISLLTEKKRILELARSLALLKTWQKQAPFLVRFTVDRMGAMAFVKFLKPTQGE